MSIKYASFSLCHLGWVHICMFLNAWQPAQKTHALLCISKISGSAPFRLHFDLRISKCMATCKKMHALPCVSKTCGSANHICVTIHLHLPVSKCLATHNKKKSTLYHVFQKCAAKCVMSVMSFSLCFHSHVSKCAATSKENTHFVMHLENKQQHVPCLCYDSFASACFQMYSNTQENVHFAMRL